MSYAERLNALAVLSMEKEIAKICNFLEKHYVHISKNKIKHFKTYALRNTSCQFSYYFFS